MEKIFGHIRISDDSHTALELKEVINMKEVINTGEAVAVAGGHKKGVSVEQLFSFWRRMLVWRSWTEVAATCTLQALCRQRLAMHHYLFAAAEAAAEAHEVKPRRMLSEWMRVDALA